MRQLVTSTVASLVICLGYRSYWRFAERTKGRGRFMELMRLNYLERWCCYIGNETTFASEPILPHGFHGIHISNGATFGKGVVIFQNVTIGSNTLKGSRRSGSPTIGNNVYIGAGAAVIGDVSIGDNCRIGANCVVVKDMPPNTVAVLGDVRYITKEGPLDNEFISWKSFKGE